jgi:Cysteine rich repeat
MTDTPTLWTTLRDFTAVVLVCIMGAVALYALIKPARADGLPPRPYDRRVYDNGAYGDYVPGPRAAWTACIPDVRRYCPNVLPGGGRILSCLAGNKDRLSLECHDALVRAWVYYRR